MDKNGQVQNIGNPATTNHFGYPIHPKLKTRSSNAMFRIENEVEEIDRTIRLLEEHQKNFNERKKRENRDFRKSINNEKLQQASNDDYQTN